MRWRWMSCWLIGENKRKTDVGESLGPGRTWTLFEPEPLTLGESLRFYFNPDLVCVKICLNLFQFINFQWNPGVVWESDYFWRSD